MLAASLEQVWQWLGGIPDPEIPVLSLVDLGVIRKLDRQGEKLLVTVTPTYSGCPATARIKQDIETALREKGVEEFEVRQTLTPPWTPAWISEAGKKKLEKYGIAPPHNKSGPAHCPQCQSRRVCKVSQFGSTPCKALWRCEDCLEPFDYFKCL